MEKELQILSDENNQLNLNLSKIREENSLIKIENSQLK